MGPNTIWHEIQRFNFHSGNSAGFAFFETVCRFLRRWYDAFFSDEWQLHLQHLTQYLQRIQECGLTLNVGKCSFAQCEVKFCGADRVKHQASWSN